MQAVCAEVCMRLFFSWDVQMLLCACHVLVENAIYVCVGVCMCAYVLVCVRGCVRVLAPVVCSSCKEITSFHNRSIRNICRIPASVADSSEPCVHARVRVCVCAFVCVPARRLLRLTTSLVSFAVTFLFRCLY